MNYWQGRRVLVTGAGGFIGSHLVEQLVRSGANVKAMVHYNSRNDWGNIELLEGEVRQSLEVICGDVRDPFFCREAARGISVVMHLAALIAIPYSYIAPVESATTNVIGTLNMLEAGRSEGIEKFVHTSTSEVYGTARYTPIDEEHPLRGQSPYSASKIGADKVAESYWLSFEMPVATVRPFNTYGPRQSARAVIPSIIIQLAAGKKQIRLGSLTPVRDFCFARDTAAGFMAVAECADSVGEVVNLGTGKGVTIGNLANSIMEAMSVKADITCDEQRVRPEQSEVMELLCNADKAAQLLGWRAAVSLHDGLAETVDYITSHRELYKSEIYNV